MYKVTQAFNERFDGNHRYEVGDTYPRKGFAPTSERVSELTDGTNRMGLVFLQVATRPRTKKPTDTEGATEQMGGVLVVE